jgi:serine/threonine-protein phosphatase 2B regulatory subunit|mmetsp:Transcript_17544/g.52793  ORF Transcript_17544/g.52793 Transcript_17544/m.52793 type:complete len:354 (-) Transcript_17544:51-1112(-)
MATGFKQKPAPGPSHISSEPQKLVQDQGLQNGLEHRPFNDEEIKQAFDTFDLDNNHFVGAAEIAHILQLIGEEVTDEEIDEMIRLCDTDGDGQVTIDEFHKLMSQPPPPLPPPPPAVTRRTRRPQAKAAMMPTDGTLAPTQARSRKMQKEEQQNRAKADSFRVASIQSLVQKLSGGIDKIKPSQIKKIYKRFQDIDVDRSGAIDYEEFIQALEMENNTISRQMFRVFDMDGSGSIELKEFIVVLSRYTSAAKSEKLKFAFMMFDEDGSGFIERNELLDMLQASFVVEALSPPELEDKADQVYDFLGLERDDAISYEDFLKLSTARNGLIYPVEEQKHDLGGQELSINAMVDED